MAASTGNASTDLENETRQLQALADAAPEEIKDDFQAVASAFADFTQALATSGYDPGSGKPPTALQIAALAAAAKVFDTGKLKAAAQHLSAWAQSNCK